MKSQGLKTMEEDASGAQEQDGESLGCERPSDRVRRESVEAITVLKVSWGFSGDEVFKISLQQARDLRAQISIDVSNVEDELAHREWWAPVPSVQTPHIIEGARAKRKEEQEQMLLLTTRFLHTIESVERSIDPDYDGSNDAGKLDGSNDVGIEKTTTELNWEECLKLLIWEMALSRKNGAKLDEGTRASRSRTGPTAGDARLLANWLTLVPVHDPELDVDGANVVCGTSATAKPRGMGGGTRAELPDPLLLLAVLNVPINAYQQVFWWTSITYPGAESSRYQGEVLFVRKPREGLSRFPWYEDDSDSAPYDRLKDLRCSAFIICEVLPTLFPDLRLRLSARYLLMTLLKRTAKTRRRPRFLDQGNMMSVVLPDRVGRRTSESDQKVENVEVEWVDEQLLQLSSFLIDRAHRIHSSDIFYEALGPGASIADQALGPEIIDALITKLHLDVNTRNRNDEGRYLLIACQYGRVSIAKVLLERGADLEHCLDWCLCDPQFDDRKSRWPTLAALLRAFGRAEGRFLVGFTHATAVEFPTNKFDFAVAILTGKIPYSPSERSELFYNCNLQRSEQRDKQGNTSLHVACLIKRGAPSIVDCLSKKYDKQISVSMSDGTHLIDGTHPINTVNKRGDSPLMLACREGRTRLVPTLLACKADANLINEQTGESALTIAWLKKGVGYETKPEHPACGKRRAQKEENSDPASRTRRAQMIQYSKIVQFLLTAEADVNQKLGKSVGSESETTLLEYARRQHDEEGEKVLLAHGAKVL